MPWLFGGMALVLVVWSLLRTARALRGVSQLTKMSRTGFGASNSTAVESVTSSDTDTVLRELRGFFPGLTIKPQVVQRLTIEGHELTVVRTVFQQKLDGATLGAVSFSQCMATLPRVVDGSVQLHRVKTGAVLWRPAPELESVDFNKQVWVYSSSRDLAFRVLSPDFMAWYLDNPKAPSVFVRDLLCVISFLPGTEPESPSEIASLANTIVKFIERSGALEKISVPT